MSYTLGIIGAGKIGRCLVESLLMPPMLKLIKVADHHQTNLDTLPTDPYLITTLNNQEAAQADVLVLAVKPQILKQVIQEIRPSLAPTTLIISVAAGIATQQIYRWLEPLHPPVIRAMPNTPMLAGCGVTGLYAGEEISAAIRQQVETLFKRTSASVWIPAESMMDMVTALSGSGPAYFFYIMEALIAGAIQLGLPAEIAIPLTLNTATGSSYMALQSSKTLAELRAQVTSPGGTTEQGIEALKNGKLTECIFAALKAAAQHGKKLSEQYD